MKFVVPIQEPQDEYLDLIGGKSFGAKNGQYLRRNLSGVFDNGLQSISQMTESDFDSFRLRNRLQSGIYLNNPLMGRGLVEFIVPAGFQRKNFVNTAFQYFPGIFGPQKNRSNLTICPLNYSKNPT